MFEVSGSGCRVWRVGYSLPGIGASGRRWRRSTCISSKESDANGPTVGVSAPRPELGIGDGTHSPGLAFLGDVGGVGDAFRGVRAMRMEG